MSSYWLQVSEPGHAPRVVTIDDRTEVGRDCDGLVVEDPTVSRRHLLLETTPDGLVCVDMGSANGTLVDGHRIEGPVVCAAGTVIRLGETELVVHQGHEVKHTDAAGTTIDPHDRPSEGLRDLSSAASKTALRPTTRPPA